MSPDRIGFIQGRLSPQVNGRIQAFPWTHWREEFAVAAQIGLGLLEWTLDHEGLHENPLLTPAGRREIAALSAAHGVCVTALTGDAFMQVPFWKKDGSARQRLVTELDAVFAACAEAGIRHVVVPLVDNGRLESPAQAAAMREVLLPRAAALRAGGLRVAFESDYPPDRLAAFIAEYPSDTFGINYDTGNSAALGYDCGVEIAAYGDRILHVHIKDRALGGTSVPLGTGNADLPRVIRLLETSRYSGEYVLQTARATTGDHAGTLTRYRDMVRGWIAEVR